MYTQLRTKVAIVCKINAKRDNVCAQPRTKVACICEITMQKEMTCVHTAKDKSNMYLWNYDAKEMMCTQPTTEVACICEITMQKEMTCVHTAKDKSNMYLWNYDAKEMTSTQPRTEVACICESMTRATRDDVCTAKDKSSMYLLAYRLCSTNVHNHHRILLPATCRHTENKKQETVRSSINQAERQQLKNKMDKIYSGCKSAKNNNNVFLTQNKPLWRNCSKSQTPCIYYTQKVQICVTECILIKGFKESLSLF